MRTRSPSLEGPSYAQFAHMLAATYSVCAKGGWGHVRAAGAACVDFALELGCWEA